MWVLLGVLAVVLGFALRLNPLLTVVIAALVTGLAALIAPGLTPVMLWHGAVDTLAVLGKAFKDNRYISVTWLILPLIGLLEREGLQERAKTLIQRLKSATTGRLLLIYMVIRQGTAALGLTSLGGHPQMVRPLIAPMAEAAAEAQDPNLSDQSRNRVKAFAAATDNIGLFFGEDIFIAIASILLIKGFLETNGIIVQPLHLSVWAIPTAIVALLVHGGRLMLLDRRLRKEAGL
ncbi:DUF969 domain-containing protein [Caulobacter mirabilis]|uniref:DUF969 domain-containing protein n=1 Tax=Caulobacter mirabilis TaxID=69666 RepID=A0A2D2B122_9CAUL|nr:DUF969 domain-containing protein [Caulobacter mirabilis]ATQ43961.1 hypothetical protein CSW64_16970 [Caulobacter mirabilis]